jgi:hypothetical protein
LVAGQLGTTEVVMGGGEEIASNGRVAVSMPEGSDLRLLGLLHDVELASSRPGPGWSGANAGFFAT